MLSAKNICQNDRHIVQSNLRAERMVVDIEKGFLQQNLCARLQTRTSSAGAPNTPKNVEKQFLDGSTLAENEELVSGE